MDSELGFRMWTKSKNMFKNRRLPRTGGFPLYWARWCSNSFFLWYSVAILPFLLFVHRSVPYPYPKHGMNSAYKISRVLWPEIVSWGSQGANSKIGGASERLGRLASIFLGWGLQSTESQALLQLFKSKTFRRSLVVRFCLLPATVVVSACVTQGLRMVSWCPWLTALSWWYHVIHVTWPQTEEATYGDMKRDLSPGSWPWKSAAEGGCEGCAVVVLEYWDDLGR